MFKMAGWSSLASKGLDRLTLARKIFASFKNASRKKVINYVPQRNSHERTFPIRESAFLRLKFKDLVYFYTTVGALPLIAIVFYCNIFIGPATLTTIPEGYEPKPWEYHRHPISRFFAKYLLPSYQEMYERTLHNIFVKSEKKQIRELELKVQSLIKERRDYQAWYYEAPSTKYPKDFRARSEIQKDKYTDSNTLAKP